MLGSAWCSSNRRAAYKFSEEMAIAKATSPNLLGTNYKVVLIPDAFLAFKSALTVTESIACKKSLNLSFEEQKWKGVFWVFGSNVITIETLLINLLNYSRHHNKVMYGLFE